MTWQSRGNEMITYFAIIAKNHARFTIFSAQTIIKYQLFNYGIYITTSELSNNRRGQRGCGGIPWNKICRGKEV